MPFCVYVVWDNEEISENSNVSMLVSRIKQLLFKDL